MPLVGHRLREQRSRKLLNLRLLVVHLNKDKLQAIKLDIKHDGGMIITQIFKKNR